MTSIQLGEPKNALWPTEEVLRLQIILEYGIQVGDSLYIKNQAVFSVKGMFLITTSDFQLKSHSKDKNAQSLENLQLTFDVPRKIRC